jgi:PAS domain S-box-containing protein
MTFMPSPGSFSDPDRGCLESLERQKCRELCLFNDIATITAHTLDLQEIATRALDAVLDFFGIGAGLLLLWDHGRQRLTSVASRGVPGDYLAWTGTGELEKIIGPYLSRATQPLLIGDVRSDRRLAFSTFSEAILSEPGIKAVVSIPLKYREEINGFLNLAAGDPAAFTPYPLYFYSILGNQIGLAIANARLYHHLRRSEQRYRRIFEGSLDMIFITDDRGRLLDVNPAGLKLLGLPAASRSQELPGLRELFEDTADWEKFRTQVEADGFVRDLELTLRKADGGRVPVLLTGIRRRRQSGEFAGYEGIIKDITERKQYEQDLLREKKTTEGILEGLPIPTFVIDRSHCITHWNRACEELTGYRREEMVGTYRYWLPFYSHEGPFMASLVVEQNFRALEAFFGEKNLKRSSAQPVAFEAYEYFPDFRGSERYFFNTSSPIYDEKGEIQGAVQAIVDVTEREQLARELRQSEEKFRSLVEASLDAIVLHRNLEMLYVNRACLEMFGYQEPTELLGRNLAEFIELPLARANPRRLTRILKGDTRPRIFEMKGVRRDGTRFDLEVVSFPTLHEGQPASQTHLRDITHKKQLEEHLARTEKLASLGQLAAGVAHEMNNPLGSIMVLSYLLLEDLEPSRPERAQVEKIVREATRCKEIVQGLLEFSRYTPSRMAPVQVNQILEEVLSLMADHLLFQHIDLETRLDPGLPLVLGDKSRLEQVFVNLLMNSAEAMEGLGRLTVVTSRVTEGDRVRLSFTDTGPGIPENLLGRLFDPFFTTKGVGKGVGLGLAISYGIIQKHLGRIFVEKTGPGGTTFVVELPVPTAGEESGAAAGGESDASVPPQLHTAGPLP